MLFSGKQFSMNMIKRISQSIALSVLLLCFNLAAADDLQEATQLFKQGQQERALAKLEPVLSAKPKDPQARFHGAAESAPAGEAGVPGRQHR